MKRVLAFMIAAATALAPISASAIDVRIDNTPLRMDVPATSINGRTMVPMRAIFESLGADVSWDSATKCITAAKENKTITLYLNNKTAYINGTAKALDAAPVSLNGRTLVPARFVAESMGCTVGWDAASQTVDISTSNNTQPTKANTYKVIRVVDGDTFVIDYNGTQEKVRLIGVDTPESVHPDASKNTAAGIKASEYTKSLLTGKSVTLEFDVQERDKYGRLLAYVFVDGYMLNKKLLQEGYAVIATYPPNVKYLNDFKAIAGVGNNTSSNTAQKTENQKNTTENVAEAAYIGNANTKKFHKATCASVKKMSNENKVAFSDRASAVSKGYAPCGNCKP